MGYVHKTFTHRFSRFLIVGAGNSAISFLVLNVAAVFLHQNKILSSAIATTCAILFSYTMNRRFVFGDSGLQLKKLASFALVATSGALVIQTLVYAACLVILNHITHISSTAVTINAANLIASICVTFWNYNGYRLFVFTAKPLFLESYGTPDI